MTIKHVGTDYMAADIYTKGFTSALKWASVLGLINVYPKEEQKKMKVRYKSV